MQELIRPRTRRHLLQLGVAATAKVSFMLSAGSSFIALSGNSAFAGDDDRRDGKEEKRRDDYQDRDYDRDRDDHKDRVFDNSGKYIDRDQKYIDRDQHECSCLLRGTNVLTPRGDVPVEELQIGNEVHTRDGIKAIKWIGYKKFQKSEGRAWNANVMPIRVTRFAIDDRTPQRDLYLSTSHCLYFDGFLIPVSYLMNGTSIAAHVPSAVETIEYYHIEFDRHEVIYAERAAVESYLATNRETFSNFVQYERLYEVEREAGALPYAPILGYHGGREELVGLAKSVISNVVDVRDPIQIVSDRIAERARAMLV
jgi:hypothetical protein